MLVRGKTAIVTGGGAGIGSAVALRLARDGAAVLVADLDERAARMTVDEVKGGGGDGRPLAVDVTSESGVRVMVEYAEETFGALHVLVNNVGNYDEPAFPGPPVEHWTRNLDRNLRSAMLGIHYALPRIQAAGGGAIVNIASAAGLGFASYVGPEYGAAKAAVMRLTASLAGLRETANVRVNCVCPNTVGTESVRAAIAEGRMEDEPLIETDEVAEAVAQLVEDDDLTGRIVVLWGGRAPQLLPALAPLDFVARLTAGGD